MRVKLKLLTLCAALMLSGMGIAKAADTDTKTPGAQGLESVDKNLAQHPDSHGLTNAQTHIQDNMAERKAHKVHHDRDDKAARAEKANRPERPAR
jgi:hypothetical protein